MMNQANFWVGKTVQFTQFFEDHIEAYGEEGTRGKIISVHQTDFHDDPDEQVFEMEIDYTDFDEFNKQFESSNYYDKNGVPCRTAREAGFYKRKVKIYLPAPNSEKFSWDNYFTVVGAPVRVLLDRYNAEGSDMSYVEWLESKVVDILPESV